MYDGKYSTYDDGKKCSMYDDGKTGCKELVGLVEMLIRQISSFNLKRKVYQPVLLHRLVAIIQRTIHQPVYDYSAKASLSEVNLDFIIIEYALIFFFLQNTKCLP